MSNETTPVAENAGEIGKLAEALATAQAAFETPTKSKTAKIKGTTKTGTPFEYQYKYSDLDDLVKATRKALTDNGLAVVQNVHSKQGASGVSTIVLHKSGQRWSSEPVFVPHGGDKPQDVGIAITYARRYSMSAALGVVAEDDLDANMQQQERGSGQRKVRLPDDEKQQQTQPQQTQQTTKQEKPTAKPEAATKAAPASAQPSAAAATSGPVEYVNKQKVKRLFGIAQVHSVSVEALKAYLAKKDPPITSSDHIPVSLYDGIIADIQNGKVVQS